MTTDLPVKSPDAVTAVLTIGRRIRHFRGAARLTLDVLAESTGIAASQLSLIENGLREPRLAMLQSIATALGIDVADLLETAPPSRRAALEISLEAAQRSPLYAALNLPSVRAARTLPLEALEALVGLNAELARRANEASATPEEARRANTAMRLWMRERDNYLPDIERSAEALVTSAGHPGGPLTHRTVERIVHRLGFPLHHAAALPRPARSVTDLEHRRIYVPPQSTPGEHGMRSITLQAVAHRVLGHARPTSYADFLRQRL